MLTLPHFYRSSFLCLAMVFLLACGETTNAPEQRKEAESAIAFSIQNLNDSEYPDNPDIGFRASNYASSFFSEGKMIPQSSDMEWSMTFYTLEGDSIHFPKLNLAEFIPTIPQHVKSDEYMSYLSCVNQEWNRNQVRFNPEAFSSSFPGVVRVDVARNCLNAYLWEVIVYIQEEGSNVPYAHGWFDFPHDKYAELFEVKNGISFNQYRDALEDWVDPPSKMANLSLLRSSAKPLPIAFQDNSDAMYPLGGAREKKFKEIVYPEAFGTMRDLQSDATLFATFSPPGMYTREDPRTTELGRIYALTNLELFEIESTVSSQPLHEIHFDFEHRDGNKKTQLIFGGLDLSKIPVLETEDANKGWKSSMGIGNHPFYESYEEHLNTHSEDSPYYAMLLDEEDNWLDSHQIGIDGPLMHFSDTSRNTLHVWLLSFERHALVGHYVIEIKDPSWKNVAV